MWTKNFQMFKLYFKKAKKKKKKAEEPELKLPIPEKAREFQKNISSYFINYTRGFDCLDHNQLWKILKEVEYQTTLPASWEICMQVKKQLLEPDMEQWTGSKLGE